MAIFIDTADVVGLLGSVDAQRDEDSPPLLIALELLQHPCIELVERR